MRIRALRDIACLAITMVFTGCDAGSLTRAPDGDPSHGAPGEAEEPGLHDSSTSGATGLLIDAPAVVTLSPSETFQLRVTAVDSTGAPLAIDLDPNWRTEDEERLKIDDGVLVAEDRPGHSWIFVEAAGLRDSLAVWVQPPESRPSDFDITFFYGEGVPAWWPLALDQAADRWRQVIRAPLPLVVVAGLADHCGQIPGQPPELRAGVESGVRILVRVSYALPLTGAPRATAGVCANRGLPHPTSVVGLVTLNGHLLGDGPPGDIAYLAHHEIGHALGLVGTVQGELPAWLDPASGAYRGHLARYGRQLDGAGEWPTIPISTGHWPFADLMGDRRAHAISHTTVGALMDLGYPAAWYGSGPIAE